MWMRSDENSFQKNLIKNEKKSLNSDNDDINSHHFIYDANYSHLTIILIQVLSTIHP